MRLLIWTAVAGVMSFLTGPAAVGLTGLGVPPAAALALSAAVLATAGLLLGRRIVLRLPPGLTAGPVWTAICLVLLLAAIVQVSRLSLFMHDVSRVSCSIVPGDAWRRNHSCLTAYFESARFLAGGGSNIYDESLYENRRIGPLRVDVFHYPPPFLLLSAGVRRAADDFWNARRLWFAAQAIMLVAAVLGLVAWVGGDQTLPVAAASALLLAAPQTLFTLQIGNFQLTAICLALLSAVLIASRQPAAGCGLLAFVTGGKIFPGVIGAYLAGGRQWRAVALTALWGAAIAALALVLFGSDVYTAFIGYELPRIHSGQAFPQAEDPYRMTANQSVYGLLTKLRMLGVTPLDRTVTAAIVTSYGYVLIAAALALGWLTGREAIPAPGRDRLARALVWLALLNLASLRSPFVGGGYGAVGTIWLLGLLTADARSGLGRAVWIALTVPIVTFIWLVPGPLPGQPVPASAYALSAGFDLLLLSVNLSVIWRALARAVRPATARAPALT